MEMQRHHQREGAARRELDTDRKVAPINEALGIQAAREQAQQILAAFDSVEMDFTRSHDGFGEGGRDLSMLESDARDSLA
jgi:hypothetical protein